MSDSFTYYNYVGNTKVSVSIKKNYANKCTLQCKQDISNWNIKIILSVLIGACYPELLSTICLMSATI